MTPTSGAPPRDIVLLGSTGSVGTQALDVVRANPDRFRVVGLVGRRQRPRAARRAGDRVRRTGRGGRPGHRRPGRPARPLRRGAAPRLPPWRLQAAADRRRPGRRGAAGRATGRHRAQRDHRSRRPAAHAGRAGGRVDAGPGQQGVADHRRRGCHLRSQARADRPGRLGALGTRPVPARRARRRGTTAGHHGERRAVPRPAPRGPGRRHTRAGDGPSDLGHGTDGDHQLLDAGQQGARGDRGAPALRHRRTTTSRWSYTPSR